MLCHLYRPHSINQTSLGTLHTLKLLILFFQIMIYVVFYVYMVINLI
jgi:hypothetical protein